MSVLETIRAQLALARRVVEALERAVHEIEAAQGEEPAAPGPAPAPQRPRRRKAADVVDEPDEPAPAPRRAAKRSVVEGQKYCRACDQSKPVAEFAVNNSRSDGRQSRCRECMSTYCRAARAAKTEPVEPEGEAEPAKPVEPAKPAGWVDPAERLKLIRERAARGAS